LETLLAPQGNVVTSNRGSPLSGFNRMVLIMLGQRGSWQRAPSLDAAANTMGPRGELPPNPGHQHRSIIGKHKYALHAFRSAQRIEHLRGGLGDWRPDIEGGIDSNEPATWSAAVSQAVL
jgi:hypothetical protein